MGVGLTEFLADRDEPCPSCGYNLCDLTSDRCPECGEVLVLSVRLAEPRLGTWLAGLIGVTTGAGFYAFISAWVIFNWLRFSSAGGPDGIDLAVIFGSMGVLGPSVAFWIIGRRWMRRQGRTLRWAFLIIAWVMCVLSFVLFLLLGA